MPTNPSSARKIRHDAALGAIAALAAAALALAGCGNRAEATGSFAKSYPVSGPVRLEISGGSGDIHISTGASDQVQINGEISVREWSEQEAQRRARDLESNPPIVQVGNTIRVGGSDSRGNSVDYTIVVPPRTEIHGVSGSGDVIIDGVQGMLDYTSGSGDISASNIGGDVQATAGSGTITLENVQGRAEVNVGSGDVNITKIKGETRVRGGSGDVTAAEAGDDLDVQTGSGDVEVNGAAADLRVRATSGDVTVTGSPAAGHFWDFHTTSGDVALNVSSSASFRLYAHSGSDGNINAAIPIVMEGTSAKHELRARIGDGAARVEVGTGSGDISLH